MKRWIAALASTVGVACGSQVACVARGAWITTPGGRRRVEELAVGDEVIAVDPATGLSTSTRITFVRSAERECGELTVAGATLAVTADHPLFDPTDRQFHPAGDWLLGRRVALSVFGDDGLRPAAVAARDTFIGVRTVFDLTVDSPFHTFVADGVLVHNKQPADCALPDGGHTNLTVPESERPTCQCADAGTGRWTCQQSGGTAVCALCGNADAGP